MAMNIAELWEKGKYWAIYHGYVRDAYLAIILLGVALGAFACGRLSLIEDRYRPISIQQVASQDAQDTCHASSSEVSQAIKKEGTGGDSPRAPGSVVGSRSGTKYHFPWCSGAKSIKTENKIWFASEAEALSAGYTKAGNCR
jgi:hypothetical protein